VTQPANQQPVETGPQQMKRLLLAELQRRAALGEPQAPTASPQRQLSRTGALAVARNPEFANTLNQLGPSPEQQQFSQQQAAFQAQLADQGGRDAILGLGPSLIAAETQRQATEQREKNRLDKAAEVTRRQEETDAESLRRFKITEGRLEGGAEERRLSNTLAEERNVLAREREDRQIGAEERRQKALKISEFRAKQVSPTIQRDISDAGESAESAQRALDTWNRLGNPDLGFIFVNTPDRLKSRAGIDATAAIASALVPIRKFFLGAAVTEPEKAAAAPLIANLEGGVAPRILESSLNELIAMSNRARARMLRDQELFGKDVSKFRGDPSGFDPGGTVTPRTSEKTFMDESGRTRTVITDEDGNILVSE